MGGAKINASSLFEREISSEYNWLNPCWKIWKYKSKYKVDFSIQSRLFTTNQQALQVIRFIFLFASTLSLTLQMWTFQN